MAFGPNSWFLIDSTPADCILVNPFDRSQELGKSTLYFIKDLFSFMITGFLVTNEEASWISQVLAFQTVVQDKVELCAQYGITIKPEDWPCIFLPDFLLEDRGEGESKYANLFANVLGVQISNTPPYRPDLKGPVELDFHLANQYALHKLEGGGPPPQKRGEKDRRGLPCLILEELIYIVIHYILTYNSTHTLDEYPFDEFMIQDKVDPVPLALWNWGIENRTGFGRVMNPETVYQALLPREFVSVSQKGINYQGLYYFSEYGAENQWYLKAGRKTGFKTLQVQIAYDPRTTNYIFVCDPQGKVIERCQLTDRSKAYANISRAEYRAQKKCEDDRRVELDNREFEAELVLDARLDHIQGAAREKAEEARENAGKAKKATSKDRRANKSEEREWRRKIDTTQDGDVKTVSGLEEAEIKPATDRVPNQHTYFAPPDYGDLIDAIDDDDQGD